MRAIIVIVALIVLCGVVNAKSQCESIIFCEECTVEAGCGWCSAKAQCISAKEAPHCGSNYYGNVTQCSRPCSPLTGLQPHAANCLVCPDLYHRDQLWYGNYEPGFECPCSNFTNREWCVFGATDNCGWCTTTSTCQTSRGSCAGDAYIDEECNLNESWDTCTGASCYWCESRKRCVTNHTQEHEPCSSGWQSEPDCQLRTGALDCVNGLVPGCGWCASSQLCSRTQGTCPYGEWINSTSSGCQVYVDPADCIVQGSSCAWCSTTSTCINTTLPNANCAQIETSFNCSSIVDAWDCLNPASSASNLCVWCNTTQECVWNGKPLQALQLGQCASPITTFSSICNVLDIVTCNASPYGCTWCTTTSTAGLQTSYQSCEPVGKCTLVTPPPCSVFPSCETCLTGCIWCTGTQQCTTAKGTLCPYDQRLTQRVCGYTNTSVSCPVCISTQFEDMALQPSTWCASTQTCIGYPDQCEVPYALGCGGASLCEKYELCQVMRNDYVGGSRRPCGWCWETGKPLMGAIQGPTNSSLCPRDRWTFESVTCNSVLPISPIIIAAFVSVIFYAILHVAVIYGCYKRIHPHPLDHVILDDLNHEVKEIARPPIRRIGKFFKKNGLYLSFFSIKAANIVTFVVVLHGISIETSLPLPVSLATVVTVTMISTFPLAIWSVQLTRHHARTYQLFRASFWPLFVMCIALECSFFVAFMVKSSSYIILETVLFRVNYDQRDAGIVVSLSMCMIMSLCSYLFLWHQRKWLRFLYRATPNERSNAHRTQMLGPLARHFAMYVKRLCNIVVLLMAANDFMTASGIGYTMIPATLIAVVPYAVALAALIVRIALPYTHDHQLAFAALLLTVVQICTVVIVAYVWSKYFKELTYAVLIVFCTLVDALNLPYVYSLSNWRRRTRLMA